MTPDADSAWEVLRWIFDKLWILLAAGFAVLRAKLRAQDGAIDEVKKSVQVIQTSYVSRDTLNQRDRDWRDELREFRKEIGGKLDNIQSRVDKLVDD